MLRALSVSLYLVCQCQSLLGFWVTFVALEQSLLCESRRDYVCMCTGIHTHTWDLRACARVDKCMSANTDACAVGEYSMCVIVSELGDFLWTQHR